MLNLTGSMPTGWLTAQVGDKLTGRLGGVTGGNLSGLATKKTQM